MHSLVECLGRFSREYGGVVDAEERAGLCIGTCDSQSWVCPVRFNGAHRFPADVLARGSAQRISFLILCDAMVPLVLFGVCFLIVDDACRQKPYVKVVLDTLLSFVNFCYCCAGLSGPQQQQQHQQT